MIRVAIVDDHPAVRHGLESALVSEAGLIAVGSAGEPEELAPLLYRTRPDVVLLDYHLPRRDGLSVCRQIKSEALAPGVVFYSAYADASLVVPAVIAGADGIVHKSARTREIFRAIRAVADDGTALPPISEEMLDVACDALDRDDRPVLDLLVDRKPRREIAHAVGLELDALEDRITRMLSRLQAPVGPTLRVTNTP